MNTFYITKKENTKTSLSSATQKMSWGNHYIYAMDQDMDGIGCQEGFPARMEYIVEDGDVIVEVDSDGKEVDRVVFRDE